jgi:hypothetical protein
MCECQRPGQDTAPAFARVRVRAVRVAFLVGEGVMLAMVGDPVDDRALHGHRAEDRDRRPEPRLGLERAVREHPVEADRDAKADQHVHDGQDAEVAPGDGSTPQQPESGQEADERKDDRHDRDAALEARGGVMRVRVRMRSGHVYRMPATPLPRTSLDDVFRSCI